MVGCVCVAVTFLACVLGSQALDLLRVNATSEGEYQTVWGLIKCIYSSVVLKLMFEILLEKFLLYTYIYIKHTPVHLSDSCS